STMHPQANAFDIALGFAQAFNAGRLSDELMRGPTNSWGGYVEWAYFNHIERAWVRGPKSANIFYVARPNDDGLYEIKLLPRAIGYDPGGEVGRILVLTRERDRMFSREFILESITSNISSTKFGYDYWTGFVPDIVSVGFIVLDGKG